ncbi:hypothetical protein [Leisingera sp. S132]|nr:hypothetical protein [Leisingera sp. S132]
MKLSLRLPGAQRVQVAETQTQKCAKFAKRDVADRVREIMNGR